MLVDLTTVFFFNSLRLPRVFTISMKEKDKARLKKIGAQLKKVRESKGMGQRELSSNCDIDYSKINKIEHSRVNMLVTTLIELAEGLGVHPRELLDFDND